MADLHQFVKSLQQYFIADVVEHHWKRLITSIKSAKTFDDVYNAHNDFIDCAVKDCMLTDKTLAVTLSGLLDDCTNYCTKFVVTALYVHSSYTFD